MNVKDFQFGELKVMKVDGVGRFTGFASTYGNTDLGNDIVDRGAFTNSLKERGPEVPILWQHDQSQPIGKGTLTDTSSGLQIDGQLTLGTARGREAYELLKDGVLKGLSIGYDVVKQKFSDGARHLQELRLFEVSLVTFPMNEAAVIEGVKRRPLVDGRYVRDYQRWIRATSAKHVAFTRAMRLERLAAAICERTF